MPELSDASALMVIIACIVAAAIAFVGGGHDPDQAARRAP